MVLYNEVIFCGHSIMAITSAFQAEDRGSIPLARTSRNKISLIFVFILLLLQLIYKMLHFVTDVLI